MRVRATMGSRGRRGFAPSVMISLAALIALGSCERKPSKSDYVSARVSETCGHLETTQELQACRLAVINQFKDVPFEEIKERYPPPEPRPRPSCSL